MSNFETFAIRPGGTEEEPVTMLDNYFVLEYGVRFPDGRVFKESVCTVKEPETIHITASGKKSPLDELVEEAKLQIYASSDGSFIGVEDAGDILEELVHLAVERHAKAVMPEPYGYVEHMISKAQYDKGNGRKECIDEIKQASDKWRGV